LSNNNLERTHRQKELLSQDKEGLVFFGKAKGQSLKPSSNRGKSVQSTVNMTKRAHIQTHHRTTV